MKPSEPISKNKRIHPMACRCNRCLQTAHREKRSPFFRDMGAAALLAIAFVAFTAIANNWQAIETALGIAGSAVRP